MDSATRIASLSSRELQIARAYAAGNGYRTIAERLFIAPSTVRTHLSTIYRKLGVSSKVDLLRTLDRNAEPDQGGAAPMPEAPRAMRSSDVTDRRQVTAISVMLDRFADIAGKLDPEETADMVGALHEIVVKEVQARNGSLVRAGHGVEHLACFGALLADETDAERAVESAVAIRREVSRLAAPAGISLATRIGVFTGPVVTTGTGERVNDVVGGAPYVATALAREASGGGIVVCERTQAMTGTLFDFADLGRVAIDGGAADIHCFAISGIAPASSRFHALHGDRLTSIVGRDHEINLLANLFECARDGQGRIALISGEAGIGKSRLVQAVCERLNLAAGDNLVFQCSPHETATALHPVRNWSHHAAGLDRQRTPEARAEALAALFQPVLEDPALERVLLAELASIRLSDWAATDSLSPSRRRAATLALLSRFVRHRADAGPIVLVFEDVHWADPTTLEWLDDVAAMSQALRVLVIVTFRPEFAFDKADLPNATHLSLARLTRQHAVRIVSQQPGAGSLPSTLVDRIVERSDGIPLFAEELTRSIVDFKDTIEAVPSTLQASLTSRLDRLDEVREVVQAAAVIGREFEFDLLRELLSVSRIELLKSMDTILASKLMLRRAPSDLAAYQFRHALVRDSAYDSLVRSKRQALHRKLARILKARRAAGRDVPAELIAHHFVEGAALDLSVVFWTEAVRTALARGAQREAAEFCRRGLSSTSAIADPIERDTVECDLQLLLYGAEYSRGDVSMLLAILEQAETIANRLDDPVRLSKVLDMKAYVLASGGRVSEAIDAARRGVAISRDVDDLHAVVGSNMMLGRSLYAAGKYREAEARARFVRDLLGEDLERGYTFGALNQTVSSRAWLTFIQAELGAFEEAERDVHKALALLELMTVSEHDRVWVAAAFGRLCFLRGDYQAVIDHLEPLLELCERHFPVYFPRMVMSLGPSLVASGQSERGISLLAQADDLGGAIDFRFGRALLLAESAQALLSTGDAPGAEETARRALKVATEAGEAGNAAWAALALGEAVSALGRTAEARTVIETAAKHALEYDMAPLSRRCDQALRLCS